MYNLSYAETADEICTDDRLNEAEALNIVISKLMSAREHGVKSLEAVDALFYTRRLWAYFMENLADDENALPENTRAELISIGIWMLKEAERLRQEEIESFDDMIQINEIIRDSLTGKAS
ncbi:flagellar protein FlaF [Roseibium hamelinense]|uniref:Flagellar protein FlaF n=1 Tax=Roseibium hamelinense TaxID=150831 RepID=A0A562TH24_9HYPH|nr:flagellar biosynthesis regulator FlaF [Roseibium hamelinense]MTI45910.1 flagellar biosynthesis regulator FlaF [Roseibium hamelinense]TWI92905.1 flagellar protein FlaF [Roseibium hamelinense]